MPSAALGLAEASPMYDHGRAWRAAFWLRKTRVSPAANIVAATTIPWVHSTVLLRGGFMGHPWSGLLEEAPGVDAVDGAGGDGGPSAEQEDEQGACSDLEDVVAGQLCET